MRVPGGIVRPSELVVKTDRCESVLKGNASGIYGLGESEKILAH